MAKASPAQNSFAGGELSPLLEGRQDLAKYPVGCRMQRNFRPLIQGPTRKRGGSGYLSAVKDSTDQTWLAPFVFSETDAVVLEFGEQYVRFYTNRGVIESSPGVVYEIASPYAAADLTNDEGSFALSIEQSLDVLYITVAGYAPRTLSRTSNTSWAFAIYAPVDGPFNPQNTDTTLTVKVSAATGSGVTFTNDSAGVPMPETNSAGRLIRVEETDKSAIKPWEANKRIAAVGENPVGELRRSDGKVYQCATNDTVGPSEVEFRTGTIRPIHTEGTESDGDGEPLYSGSTLFAEIVGVAWTYLHAGYGVAKIVSMAAGGATGTADILTRFPASVVHPNTSYRWSLGAWYAGSYPSCTAFHAGRLGFGMGRRAQLSVADDFSSHAPDEFGEVLPDSAIDIDISLGQLDQIAWMSSQSDGLLIGTGGAEILLRAITTSQVFGPTNVKFVRQSNYGSRKIRPINAEDAMLFVQSGGEKVREATFDGSRDQFTSIDVTSLAEHITKSGITWSAYAKNPGSVIYYGRADGKVAALTYQVKEEVRAWSLDTYAGGIVECGAVIPSPVAGVDDLYLIVRRTINGQTVRYVEWLTQPHTSPADPHLHCGFDCSLTYNGAQAATLTPGTGATVSGSTGVTFTAGSSVFVSGDVGREIRRRWYDEDTETWQEAQAQITGYTSGLAVTATIIGAFPSLSVIAADGWGLTATTISNLDHLEGETVSVNGDGADFEETFVVSSGEITLPRACLVAHVGFPVRGVVQLMNLEAGAEDGTAQGKVKRILGVVWRLFETMGGRFGRDLSSTIDRIRYRKPSQAMGRAMPLFTGDKYELWPGGHETEGRITFVHDEGTPCTLVAVFPQLDTSGKASGT
jgi:hypothetical protein